MANARWLVVLCALLAACDRRPPPLQYGSLRVGDRSLDYKPGIQWWALPNKLIVALVPDDRVNLVSVDVRYLVGAAEDPPGKAGLAHLVEHVMFEQRTAPGAPSMGERLGQVALTHNAATSWDATHYAEVALAERLDDVLGIEATRMALGCSGIAPADFERERAIVQQEIAQRGTHAFGKALRAAMFGAGHAYSRPIGGEDVSTLTLDDVCQFVDAHYAPSTAILVIGGRIDPVALRRGLTARFGSISRRAKGRPSEVAPAKWTGATATLPGETDAAFALVGFETAPWGSEDAVYDRFADSVLASRLGKLARDNDWLTGYAVGTLGDRRTGARYFAVQTRDPNQLALGVERIYALAAKPLTDVETQILVAIGADFQRELLDDFESLAQRGERYADFLQFASHQEFQLRELRVLQSIDVEQVSARLKRMVATASRVVHVNPRAADGSRLAGDVRGLPSSADEGPRGVIDHPVWRAPVDEREASRPLAVPRAVATHQLLSDKLDNGLRVLMVPDFSQPVFEARLVFPAGESMTSPTPGLATMAAGLLEHDIDRPYKYGDLFTLKWMLGLGAQLSTRVTSHTMFRVRGFSLFADWHLWRLHWLLESGVYDRAALDRLHARMAERSADDADDDGGVERTWRRALYEAMLGARHPMTLALQRGPGALAGIDGDALAQFRAQSYGAAGATLIIVGNFDAASMQKTVRELFGRWPVKPEVAASAAIPAQPVAGPTWVSVADGEAAQTRVTYAFASTSSRQKARGARAVVAELVRARVEQVRTRLGASYGVDAGYDVGAAGDVLAVDGYVAPERAGEVVKQIDADLDGLRRGDDALAADFVRARRAALSAALADPSRSSLEAARLEEAITSGLPLDAASLATEIASTTLDDARAVIAQDLQAARMVVVLTGRPAATEAALHAAGVATFRAIAEPPKATKTAKR